MSTLEFQKALVQLVKLPALNRGDNLERFLDGFDLTQTEQWQLRSLSVSPFVKSFANLQRKKRFGSNVMEVFPVSMRIMGQKKSLDLYYNKFEPLFIATPEEGKPAEFIDFIRGYQDNLKDYAWSSCIADILEYEYCEYLLYGGHIDKTWSVSSESLLRADKPFILKEFNYLIVEFFEVIKERDEEEALKDKNRRDSEQLEEIKFLPSPGNCTILFLKSILDDGEEELEQFEIEDDIKLFLKGQQKDPADTVLTKPPFYDDLLDAGLVKG